jgi:hypothetical protein
VYYDAAGCQLTASGCEGCPDFSCGAGFEGYAAGVRQGFEDCIRKELMKPIYYVIVIGQLLLSGLSLYCSLGITRIGHALNSSSAKILEQDCMMSVLEA